MTLSGALPERAFSLRIDKPAAVGSRFVLNQSSSATASSRMPMMTMLMNT